MHNYVKLFISLLLLFLQTVSCAQSSERFHETPKTEEFNARNPLNNLWKASLERRYLYNAAHQLILQNTTTMRELSDWANFSNDQPIHKLANYSHILNGVKSAKYYAALTDGALELKAAYRNFLHSRDDEKTSEQQLQFVKLEQDSSATAHAQRDLDSCVNNLQKCRHELMLIAGEDAVMKLESDLSKGHS
ncbi:MAG: hypothetical protein U0103_13040 [Candidatus Obscuribacterales bacterium]